MEKLKIIECPRDAMQGIKDFIPTTKKVEYINSLLKVGFDTIDFGSFVSPKTIPQLKDTAEVLQNLDLENTCSKLLAIIANERGAEDASQLEEIDFLGYPFSISEIFQKRNTNTTIEGSLTRLDYICNIADKCNKKLVVYLSMGFGNPYGEAWSPEIIMQWTEKLNKKFGVQILALSDTIGVATPSSISHIFTTILPEFPSVEFGAHLHTTPQTYSEKISAAYHAGCRRFDGAIRGYGGCPMAEDDLTGNMPTEKMIQWFEKQKIPTNIHKDLLHQAILKSNLVFN